MSPKRLATDAPIGLVSHSSIFISIAIFDGRLFPRSVSLGAYYWLLTTRVITPCLASLASALVAEDLDVPSMSEARTRELGARLMARITSSVAERFDSGLPDSTLFTCEYVMICSKCPAFKREKLDA